MPWPDANAATMELNGSQRMPFDALRTDAVVLNSLGLKYKHLRRLRSGDGTSQSSGSSVKVSFAPL